MMSRNELDGLKCELGWAMREEEAANAALSEPMANRQAQIESIHKHYNEVLAPQLAAQADARERRTRLEEMLRAAVVEFCQESGVKTIDKQLGASETVKYAFDVEQFLPWAEENAPIVIRKAIDEKTAASIVESLPVLPPGVTKTSSWSAKLTKVKEWFASEVLKGVPF